jgi:serine/threonine protein kinase
MTRITSPYLVRLIDTKKTKRFYYLFLEFCYGGDLDVLIKKKGPVSEEVGRRWLL